MANLDNAYIVTINIKEIQAKRDKKNNPWWSILTQEDEYYSVKDPMIAAQLGQGYRSVSVVDNPAGDKVFHNIVGIAAPAPIDSPDMSSIMPGSAIPQPTAAPQMQTKSQHVASPNSPVYTPPQMGLMEVRAKALEMAVVHCKGDNTKLAIYRDAFYNYIVNGAPVEQLNGSTEEFNEFIAKAQ